LVVQEAAAGREGGPFVVGGVDLGKGTRVIESAPRHRIFELVWDSYVACCITNESFSSPDSKDEKRESGTLLRLYSKSHFLDHIRTNTIATEEHPGPLLHVCVVCLNHVVDVVATKLPEIRKLAGDSLPIV
jgi:hypothetical protein